MVLVGAGVNDAEWQFTKTVVRCRTLTENGCAKARAGLGGKLGLDLCLAQLAVIKCDLVQAAREAVHDGGGDPPADPRGRRDTLWSRAGGSKSLGKRLLDAV